MSEENTTSENVSPKPKRHYVKRQAEFYDMDVTTLLVLKDDLNTKLKAINKSLKITPNESADHLKFEQKEIINKRIRIYARLRKLGHDTMAARKSKAAEKKNTVDQPATATPETPTAPSA